VSLARSGFVAVVGRPNVGKSTLLNQILGQKVSIVSTAPQTTRSQVRGILHRDDTQVVFVDTPGIHKPRSPIGGRLNDTAVGSISDTDVACLVIDATAPVGPGDRFVAARLPSDAVIVVNKIDLASPEEVLAQLTKASGLELAGGAEASDGGVEFFPVSATTGAGVDDLVTHLVSRLPDGPAWYPQEQVRDSPEGFWVAELVREQLLAILREELPHSIATRVTEWEWPRIRCEIVVERESQKGIVIGHKGKNLKQVGTMVRHQLPDGAHIELHVVVDRSWQHRDDIEERFGY